MVLSTTIGVITSVVVISIVVLMSWRAGVVPVVIHPIVGFGVVRARWCALGNITIMAGILRSGIVVSAATQVSASAGSVLAIVIIITGAGWVDSAVGIPTILSSVCGDYWCAITPIIIAIIVGAGTSQACLVRAVVPRVATLSRSIIISPVWMRGLHVGAPPWARSSIQLVEHSNIARGALRSKWVSLRGHAARNGWDRDSHLL